MPWKSVVAKLLDPYDFKACLLPGLLVLLPAIAFLTLLYGSKNPVLVALLSVLSSCGGPYLLASFIRTWGQSAQERLYKKWGAQPSTILLRHRDQRLANQTKLRYQQLVKCKLGIMMPSSDEEAADPGAADNSYRAAADALRPLTGDKKKYPFIFKELVAYGFNRNAFGARWFGVIVTIIVMFATLTQAGALQTTEPWFQMADLYSLKIAHILILTVSAVQLLMWIFHFTPNTVEQAGFTYALRLWESLETVGKKPVRKMQ